MEEEKKYFGGWVVWCTLLFIGFILVMWALSSAGFIGRTVLERKVFENSYQYSEARKTEQLTYQAQLAEVEAKLSSPTTPPEVRANLEAQAAALRIQLNVAGAR